MRLTQKLAADRQVSQIDSAPRFDVPGVAGLGGVHRESGYLVGPDRTRHQTGVYRTYHRLADQDRFDLSGQRQDLVTEQNLQIDPMP